MNQSSSVTPSANPKALLPILLFLTVYLGNGIFFEYIKPSVRSAGVFDRPDRGVFTEQKAVF